MVESCCVVGCSLRRGATTKALGIRFFPFPKNKRKRASWQRAVNRKNWIPKHWERVCSRHFVDSAHSDNPSDVNYRPTLFMKPSTTTTVGPVSVCSEGRKFRHFRRHVTKTFDEAMELAKNNEACLLKTSVSFHDYLVSTPNPKPPVPYVPTFAETACQTEEDLVGENEALKKRVADLEGELQRNSWGIHKIQDNDKATRFYTGLPSFAVFFWLFNFLRPKAEKMSYRGDKVTQRNNVRRMSLSLMDQFLAVMLRLKVGVFLQDLADRFNVSCSLMSKVFSSWIVMMERELEVLNPCPTREELASHLPLKFQNYPNCRFIIDCTEIFIERASSLTAQNLTFSNYKHHNTLKFLISITPTGAINFISKAWGGRASDRCITERSGFLDLLKPGDFVLADKGFTIGDLLARHGAFLDIPDFLYKKQFTKDQVEHTKRLAEVRIYVEQAIGRVKCYHILDPVIPLSLNKTIESIFRVCCFLANFNKPLVR